MAILINGSIVLTIVTSLTTIISVMRQLYLCLPFIIFASSTIIAQRTSPWNGKKCAVVLSYDDALNTHVNNVIPALDSLSLLGTFYISDYFGGLRAQIPKWRKAAEKGHELGNHTIHHPCLGSKPGREFVRHESDMNNYSIKRMTDEIKAMNTLLAAIDGKNKRTFAYPCGDSYIRDTFYINGLKDEFVAARGVRSYIPTIDSIDLFNIDCYPVNGQSGRELIAVVERAVARKGFLVFLFHGVGGEHSLNVSLKAHSELLHYLKSRQNDIWVAPLVEVVSFLRQRKN